MTPKLNFNFEIKCVNCKSLINTDISYLGSSNYTEKEIHCTNCNHKFILKISNNSKEYNVGNICPSKYLDTPYCRCSSCEKWLSSFTFYIENNIENFRSDLITYINNKEDKNKHSNLSLEQLYKIHKNQ